MNINKIIQFLLFYWVWVKVLNSKQIVLTKKVICMLLGGLKKCKINKVF